MSDRISQLKEKKKELEKMRDDAVYEQNRYYAEYEEYNRRAADEAAVNPYFKADININVINARSAYKMYNMHNETVIYAYQELENVNKELEVLKSSS